MTRREQMEAAIIQALTPGSVAFMDLLSSVQRAFPDASATEVDQVARQWERGRPGAYIYSLEPLPVAEPCECGYQDRDFCPRHGEAMREVVEAMVEGRREAAQAAANRYAKSHGAEEQLPLFGGAEAD